MKSRQNANERDSIVAILGLSMGLLFWLVHGATLVLLTYTLKTDFSIYQSPEADRD